MECKLVYTSDNKLSYRSDDKLVHRPYYKQDFRLEYSL